jgi:hypothetical protein
VSGFSAAGPARILGRMAIAASSRQIIAQVAAMVLSRRGRDEAHLRAELARRFGPAEQREAEMTLLVLLRMRELLELPTVAELLKQGGVDATMVLQRVREDQYLASVG